MWQKFASMRNVDDLRIDWVNESVGGQLSFSPCQSFIVDDGKCFPLELCFPFVIVVVSLFVFSCFYGWFHNNFWTFWSFCFLFFWHFFSVFFFFWLFEWCGAQEAQGELKERDGKDYVAGGSCFDKRHCHLITLMNCDSSTTLETKDTRTPTDPCNPIEPPSNLSIMSIIWQLQTKING